MPDEKPAPLPLTGEEVQQAVLYKIAESFEKTCHLRYDNAYTSFKAEITVKLTLSDYGRQVTDNHTVELSKDSGLPAENPPREVEASLTVDPMPPNKVRVETGQDVPVEVVENRRRRVKMMKYAARKAKPDVPRRNSES